MHLLPVVLRPEPGEVLVSWLHRIAAIYDMELGELLGTELRCRDLAISPDELALRTICQATRIEPHIARLHTFCGYFRDWPDHWATRWIIFNDSIDNSSYDPAPWMQVCTRCLREDQEHGVQFLRLHWLSAAATFCRQHHEPLLDCCTHCARACALRCRRVARLFYFVCDSCREVQGTAQGKRLRPGEEEGVQWMLRFERTLSHALDGRHVDTLWAGPSTPQEFVRLVEDLVWALSRPSKINPDRSPIVWFALNRFPHSRHRFRPKVEYWLSRATVQRRRALLAAVACLLIGPELRRVMENDPWALTRGTSLMDLAAYLTDSFREELFFRSRRWPPKLQESLRLGALGQSTR